MQPGYVSSQSFCKCAMCTFNMRDKRRGIDGCFTEPVAGSGPGRGAVSWRASGRADASVAVCAVGRCQWCQRPGIGAVCTGSRRVPIMGLGGLCGVGEWSHGSAGRKHAQQTSGERRDEGGEQQTDEDRTQRAGGVRGIEPHRLQHMAARHLAGTACRAGADADTVEIERDHLRICPHTRQHEAGGVGKARRIDSWRLVILFLR